MVATDGGLFAFGDAPFFGSLGGLGITGVVGAVPLIRPIRTLELLAFQSGPGRPDHGVGTRTRVQHPMPVHATCGASLHIQFRKCSPPLLPGAKQLQRDGPG